MGKSSLKWMIFPLVNEQLADGHGPLMVDSPMNIGDLPSLCFFLPEGTWDIVARILHQMDDSMGKNMEKSTRIRRPNSVQI